MTLAITTTTQPQHKPVQRRISAKVRIAIEAMVWEGLKRDAAAEKAGLKDNSLYVALRKPDVKRFYLDELDVLRTSDRARRYHRLMALGEQDDNKAAAVSALNSLERIDEQGVSVSAPRQAAGITIVIEGNAVLAQERSNEAKPLIEHEPVRDGE